MKPARKLVSGRVTLEEFTELRNYAAAQGVTQDALVARLVRALLLQLKRNLGKGTLTGPNLDLN